MADDPISTRSARAALLREGVADQADGFRAGRDASAIAKALEPHLRLAARRASGEQDRGVGLAPLPEEQALYEPDEVAFDSRACEDSLWPHVSKSMENPHVIPLNPITEIASVIEAEAVNLRATQSVLGERRKLASDVLSLYDLLTRNVAVERASAEEEQLALFVMLMLVAACRFQMTMGVLQNWRGRAAEALSSLRRASELCASACHIRRNPDLANVWLSACHSDEAYRKHKDSFRPKAIFPRNDPALNRLFEVFDFASKVIHCSIYSLAGQMRDMEFQYFDIKGPKDPALIRTFIYIISAHELMLRAFVNVFEDVLRDKAAVDKELKIFSDRLQRHREANRAFAMSDISKEILDRVTKRKT